MEDRWIGGTLLLSLLLLLGFLHYGEMKALQKADWDPKMKGILEKLRGGETIDRKEALRLLSLEKGRGRSAVPLLISLLKDRSPSIRAGAIRVLGQLGSKKIAVLRGLADGMLDDPDPEVRQQAFNALSQMGEGAIPAFLRALKHENWEMRVQGVRALSNMGPKAISVVLDLAESLRDKRREVRVEALKALSNMGPEGSPAFPALVSASKDKDPQIRKLAGEALEKVMVREDSFVEAYLKRNTLQAISEEKRFFLSDLEGLIQRGDRVFPFLLKGLKGPKKKEAPLSLAYIECYPVIAAISILKLERENPRSWKILKTPLPSSKASKRAIVKALFSVALEDKTLMEFLVQHLKDPEIREVVFLNLKAMEGSLPHLSEALLDPQKKNLHLEIARVLEAKGPRVAPALPVLIRLLNSSDWKAPQKKLALFKILENLDEKAAPAIPALLPLLKNPPFQDPILEILGNIGPSAKKAIPSLLEWVKENKEALSKVLETLRKIDVPSADALLVKSKPLKTPLDPHLDKNPLDKNRIPSLILGLRSKNDSRREQAVQLLLEQGPRSSPAVPDLIKAGKDDTYWRVRVLSIQALGKIGSPAAPAIPLLVDIAKTSTFKPLQEGAITALGEILGTLDGASDSFERGAKTLKWAMDHHDSPAAKKLAREAFLKLTLKIQQMKVKEEVLRLMGQLEKGNDGEKLQAIIELGKIGFPAAPAVPLLMKAISSINWNIQRAAIKTLGTLGPAAGPAVPLLIRKLKYWQVRMEIIETLGQIGPGSVSALPALEGLLGSRNSKTREAVQEALRKIKKETKKP